MPLEALSFTFEATSLILILAWAEARFTKVPALTFAVFSGLGFFGFAWTLIEILSLAMTALRILDVFQIAKLGGDLRSVAEEINFTSWRQVRCFFPMVIIFVTGVVLHLRVRKRISLPPFLPFASLALFILFGLEQKFSNAELSYGSRPSRMPLYLNLFASPLTYSSLLPETRTPYWKNSLPPLHRSVVMIILESVRADAITQGSAPHLFQVRSDSFSPLNAHSEATSTFLSWNVLLAGRVLPNGLAPNLRESEADLPMNRILAAGLNLSAYFSMDIHAKSMAARIFGTSRSQTSLGSGDQGNLMDRLGADTRTSKAAVKMINRLDWKQNQFLIFQFQGTHWPYDFEGQTPGDDVMLRLSQKQADHIHDRYLKSVHSVDEKIHRVIEALKEKGVWGELFFGVTSDHGELFKVGEHAHFEVKEDSFRVPYFIHWPKQLKAEWESRRQEVNEAAHRDFLPALIQLGDRQNPLAALERMHVESANPYLVWRGDLRAATLVTPHYEISFLVEIENSDLRWAPVAATERSEKRALESKDLQALAWQAWIDLALART